MRVVRLGFGLAQHERDGATRTLELAADLDLPVFSLDGADEGYFIEGRVVEQFK